MSTFSPFQNLVIQGQLRDNCREVFYSLSTEAVWPMTPEQKKLESEGSGFSSSLTRLLKLGQEGDQRALEEIYGQYKTYFFNLAYRYTYNHAEAEDLLQEIFVKIFSHLGDVQDEKTFVPWMYRIAVNTCYSYLRSKRSKHKRPISLTEIEGRREEATYDSTEESLAVPIERAVGELPEKLRAVFLLHDVQGFKHEEIAQTLGCSVGTSKSQLFKARMKIRHYLKDKQLI